MVLMGKYKGLIFEKLCGTLILYGYKIGNEWSGGSSYEVKEKGIYEKVCCGISKRYIGCRNVYGNKSDGCQGGGCRRNFNGNSNGKDSRLGRSEQSGKDKF